MTKLRVLLILHELSLSGAPKVALDLFAALSATVEVHIVTLLDGPLLPQARVLGTVTNIQELHHTPQTLRERMARKTKRARLETLLRQWKPDVIYVNSVAALPALPLMDYTSAPVLLHVHELEAVIHLFTRNNPSLLTERPTRYIAVSEAVQRALTDVFHIDSGKIEVVHECVPSGISLALPPVTPKSADAPFVVGGAGKPELRKGITLWLQMASELAALVGADRVRFMWVGVRDDFDGELFRVMARRIGLEACMEFVALTPEPFAYFAQFDVLALTSWEDPCPLVVLEAMLLEKPVACFTEGGGAVEEIGDTGLAIAGFSPQAMAQAIASLIPFPELRADMGKRARARVLDNFVTAVQAPKIEQQIRQLAGSTATCKIARLSDKHKAIGNP